MSVAHGEFTEMGPPRTPLTDADSAVAMDFSDITEQDWDPKACLTPVKLDGSSSSSSCPGPHAGMGSACSSMGLQHSCPALYDREGGACAVCNIEVCLHS